MAYGYLNPRSWQRNQREHDSRFSTGSLVFDLRRKLNRAFSPASRTPATPAPDPEEVAAFDGTRR